MSQVSARVLTSTSSSPCVIMVDVSSRLLPFTRITRSCPVSVARSESKGQVFRCELHSRERLFSLVRDTRYSAEGCFREFTAHIDLLSHLEPALVERGLLYRNRLISIARTPRFFQSTLPHMSCRSPTIEELQVAPLKSGTWWSPARHAKVSVRAKIKYRDTN